VAKVYNENFKRGVVLTVVVFAVLNIADYFYEHLSYQASPIKLAPRQVLWGVPFPWSRNDASGIDQMLNGLIIAAVAFVAGFISKLIFDKAE
jgi:hypothetical protein